jgi:ribonucleotide reductase beta subunit family protein with ferritin-like domain
MTNNAQTARLLTPKSVYTFDYPEAVEFADKQNSIFWLHNEIDLEKDIQDILVNLTEAERHGVITVLKLFTEYELNVGGEYWGDKIVKYFNRPDIIRMANCFSFFELNVHAPFYNRINELLHLNTEEFYTSYKNDPVLSSRMAFIDEVLNDDDIAYSLGVFAMVEGAILYSNFAFLKHFQSQGKNKMKNLIAGLNFGVRDENLHHLGACWLFRTLLSELKLSPEQQTELYERIYKAADMIREHEHKICDMIFEKGKIEGITAHQMKNFIDSRIDLCLQNLGLQELYRPASNPIGEWFYLGISQTVIHDFFAQVGSQYHRNWSEESFAW